MPYLKKNPPQPEPIDCRIMTAALDLFTEHGYHNVSVHDVQKKAGVSIGSIYNHFGGKEGIAKALYYHLLNEMDELVEGVIAGQPGVIERCEEIIRLLFGYAETHRNIIAFVFNARHREFLAEEPPIYSSVAFQKMQGMVAEGIATGVLRGVSPIVATAAIFGGAFRLIQMRIEGTIGEPLTRFLDEVLTSAWDGMRAPAGSGTAAIRQTATL